MYRNPLLALCITLSLPTLASAATYTVTDLGTLGGTQSFGWGINDSGQVAGYAQTPGNAAQHAFLYDAINGMVDLNTLIVPLCGWILREGRAINDVGQITGYGTIGGQNHAFLLTPVPEPSSLALATTAIGGLVTCGWLRARCRRRTLLSIAGSLVFAANLFALVPSAARATMLDGLTQATASTSALQILNGNPGAPSGLYWINPNGGSTADAFQVYCDMITDGGGWTLALASVAGSEPSTNDIVANTGTPSPASGHSRAIAPSMLTDELAAQIRHTIVATTGQVFNARYTGRFHDPLPAFASWSPISGHTIGSQSLLTTDFGQPWSSVGPDAWYFAGTSYSSVPSLQGDVTSGPVGDFALATYHIWIRGELQTPAPVPEPSSLALAVIVLCFVSTAAVGRGLGRRAPARQLPTAFAAR